MKEKILDTILEEWWQMAFLVILFGILVVLPIVMVVSGNSGVPIRGYVPHENGERVVCVYNDRALYCSEE